MSQQPPSNPNFPGWQPDQQPYNQQPFNPQYQGPLPYQQMPPLPPVQPVVKKSRRAGLIIALAAMVIVLALCAVIGTVMSHAGATVATTTTTSDTSTTTQQQPQQPTGTWKTTHTFTGNGTKNTATFAVGNDWKLNWSCDPASFQNTAYNVIIMVYNSDGSIADSGVNSLCKKGATTGTTEIRVSGNVYLGVISEGSWSAVIQELK